MQLLFAILVAIIGLCVIGIIARDIRDEYPHKMSRWRMYGGVYLIVITALLTFLAEIALLF